MDLTKDWLVRMSWLPISVIIVGIGNEDFSKMEALDSDGQLLRASCGMAERDIVQFVPFNKFNGDPGLLAAEVLREVPGQVTGFYKSKKLAPKPPIHKDVQKIGAGNFDRTGNLMDQAYMQAHPRQVAGNVLGALGGGKDIPQVAVQGHMNYVGVGGMDEQQGQYSFPVQPAQGNENYPNPNYTRPGNV